LVVFVDAGVFGELQVGVVEREAVGAGVEAAFAAAEDE
jgi:hypothetical protein